MLSIAHIGVKLQFFHSFYIRAQIVSFINVNEIIHVKWNSVVREKESVCVRCTLLFFFCYVMHKCNKFLVRLLFLSLPLSCAHHRASVIFISVTFIFFFIDTCSLTRAHSTMRYGNFYLLPFRIGHSHKLKSSNSHVE